MTTYVARMKTMSQPAALRVSEPFFSAANDTNRAFQLAFRVFETANHLLEAEFDTNAVLKSVTGDEQEICIEFESGISGKNIESVMNECIDPESGPHRIIYVKPKF